MIAEQYVKHLDHLVAAYATALQTHGYDHVVITSGTPKSRSSFDDQFWPLRVTPHFAHLLPLAEPDCLAILSADGRQPTLVWLREQNFWEQPAPPEQPWFEVAWRVVKATTLDALRGHVPEGRVAFVGEEAKRATLLGLEAQHNPEALVKSLDQLRVHKTPYERRCIDEANRRAALGHAAVRDAFLAGAGDSELDLHLIYLKATEQDDWETPYKNIVALGTHAATLHHVSYDRRRDKHGHATSLLLDAGATYAGYHSDITRTYVRGNEGAAKEFAALVAATDRLQQRLVEEARVGLKYEALHDRAHDYLGEALAEAGVLKCSAQEAVASRVTRAFLPHGLGHSLGLQTHDVGCAELKPRADNPFLRNTTVIAPEQVFTIEPGIYFVDLLLEPLRASPKASLVNWITVDALQPFGGIRIEDDLRVVDGEAPENFTRRYL